MPDLNEQSKFHFYSFGTVAANKPRDTNNCEIFPQEKFTMTSGEITDNVSSIDVKGLDGQGNPYQGQIKTKPSITCAWLSMGESNRVTAPDVRRGEQVIIYRYADTQYYFWSSMNNVIRKLETVTHWYSGTPDDGSDADTEKTAENGYVFEVSTHEGHILIQTSKKNGEATTYTLALDTKNGQFNLQDDLGNDIELLSVDGVLNVTTNNEVNVKTKRYSLVADESITFQTKTFKSTATDSTTFETPTTTMTQDMVVNGASLQKGFVNMTTGLGGGNSGDQNAQLSFMGNVKQVGDWQTQGNMSVTGTGNFTGNLTAPNIAYA